MHCHIRGRDKRGVATTPAAAGSRPDGGLVHRVKYSYMDVQPDRENGAVVRIHALTSTILKH